MEYTTSIGAPAAAPVAPVTPVTPAVEPGATVQPALSGFETLAPRIEAPADVPAVAARARTHAAADRRGPRHRYWSMRDLSRRIWLGRGYALLRGLIRAGILPATRSTQSWWIDDADVQGLVALFEDRAGKVRAFRLLDQWLRERCYVAPRTPETEAVLDGGGLGFAWRGNVYLPQRTWRVDFGPDGRVVYEHPSGATIPPTALPAAA